MSATLRERYELFKQRVERRGLWNAVWNIPLARLLWLVAIAPNSEATDRLYAYIDFVKSNGRRPSERMLFNDAFYRLKRSGELASPLRVRTTDKELAKRFTGERIGDAFVVPTLAVLRSEAEVRAYDFPERCAIKPTHATWRMILRAEGEPIDLDAVVSWLDYDQYVRSREANYRALEKKIIVEPLLDFGGEISVYCYRGRATMINYRKPIRRLFTPAWVDLNATWEWTLPAAPEPIPVPPRLDDIVRSAEALATDFPLVRIDIYIGVDGDGYRVGEITHCPSSAGQNFRSIAHEAFVSSVLFGDDAWAGPGTRRGPA